MSWLSKLYETYEANVGGPSASIGEMSLLPVGHIRRKAYVEIVLDAAGNFRRAMVIDGIETMIPATEDSEAGRTSTKVAPHPLCDTIQYVANDYGTGGYGGKKKSGFVRYAELLAKWHARDPHPKLAAVLAYIRKGCVVADLVAAGVLYVEPNTKDLAVVCQDGPNPPAIFRVIPKDRGKRVANKFVQEQGNAFVRWRVEVPGIPESGTWEDQELVKSWTEFIGESVGTCGLCFVTGRNDRPVARLHPKGLRHGGDNAKLISSNDEKGFTFRGRFLLPEEAATVSAEASQKFHSALRWLIRRQSYRHGGQVIVAWAVTGKRIPDPLAGSDVLFQDYPEQEDVASIEVPTPVSGDLGQAFTLRLAKRIAGYHAELGPTEEIVVMGLDSATSGRLAVTFYRELTGSDFLNRISDWHETFAWQQRYPDKLWFIGAPAPRDIAKAAYGVRLDDNRSRALVRATVERLLPCIVDGRRLPRDLMEAAVRRTSRRGPMKPGSSDEKHWEKLLGISCSLFKGYYIERSYKMALETDRRTREYLYGRLLAIAEHIEAKALRKAGESRDTNAGKMMARFADRPYSTWLTIEKSLQPYKTRLHSKDPAFLARATALMDQVHCEFPRVEDYADDRPLTGEYLLGYHCQRADLRRYPSPSEEEAQQDVSDSSSAKEIE
jgi:CRISPR-associated protein Csd1